MIDLLHHRMHARNAHVICVEGQPCLVRDAHPLDALLFQETLQLQQIAKSHPQPCVVWPGEGIFAVSIVKDTLLFDLIHPIHNISPTAQFACWLQVEVCTASGATWHLQVHCDVGWDELAQHLGFHSFSDEGGNVLSGQVHQCEASVDVRAPSDTNHVASNLVSVRTPAAVYIMPFKSSKQ